MNKNLFDLILLSHAEDQASLAEFLGLTKHHVSAKLDERGGFEFNQAEISMIKEKFSLSPEEIDNLFFNQEVS